MNQPTQIRNHVSITRLSRDTAAVVTSLEQGDVQVTSAGSSTELLLTTVARADAAAAAGEVLADFLLVAYSLDKKMARRTLRRALPWTGYLTKSDRRDFVEDLHREAFVARLMGDWRQFATVLDEWKNTAEILADVALAAELAEPVAGDNATLA